jgi:spore maturation protein CgeB
MTPEEAYSIFEAIAEINGLKSNLHLFTPTEKEIEDEKTAVMYEPKDVNDLKKKMQMLLENSDKSKCIAENGKRFLAEECNERIMTSNIEKCIRLFMGLENE